MKRVARIGIDLAKNVFQIHGVNAQEKVVLCKRLPRDKVLEFFAKLNREENCLIGMEACCGSDYWARELVKMGYNAKMMNPRFVKAYVKSNKNDKRDAEAICEAVGRPSMRFVPIKTLAQQDLILVHRTREQLIRRRTAQANQMRGLLLNYGIAIPKGINYLRKSMPVILENKQGKLTVKASVIMQELYQAIIEFDNKIDAKDTEIVALVKSMPAVQRLMTIPGVGIMIASAIVAWFGDATQFKCARDAAAFVGLTPQQHSSGEKERLGHISKRGNRYLRTLLITGAHADLRMANVRKAKELHNLRDEWSTGIMSRRHQNIAAVAIAAKNVRIAFAILRDETTYEMPTKMAA